MRQRFPDVRAILALTASILLPIISIEAASPARRAASRKSVPRKPPSAPKKLDATVYPVPLPKYMGEIIEEAATQYDVDPNLVARMAYRESRFNPQAVSRVGAQGVMQLVPRTAKYLGVTNPFDVRQNIFGGTKYLREMLDTFDGDVEMALAGYNAGPTAVKKKGKGATQEAVDYVAAILKDYKAGLLGQ
ncbi:MAG TPA: lytic transglycosylase domain-containing protein [Thermoanaerobaculia bacterium]|nr:lytic transglycosylase domain-containing protein [Thermoanaerobaculia bacterium]